MAAPFKDQDQYLDHICTRSNSPSAAGPQTPAAAPGPRDVGFAVIQEGRGAAERTFMMRRGSSERVGQAQMLLDQKAILHVFGVKHRAAGQQCRRDDHRIIDREAVAFRQGAPGLMRLQR